MQTVSIVMVTRSVWTSLFLLLMAATVRAHLHFVRLAVMALTGLAGMYMLHLLAQDYNKITNRPNRPAAPKALLAAGKALGLFKRSVPSVSKIVGPHKLISLILRKSAT